MNKFSLKNIELLNSNYKEKLLGWRNQIYIRKYMFNSNRITEDEHKRYISGMKNWGIEKQLFICFLNDDPIAVIQYYPYEQEIEVGYYIIKEELQGQGIAKTIEYILLEYIFCYRKQERVVTRTLSENYRGIHLQKSMGFEEHKSNDKITCQYIERQKWNNIRDNLKDKVGINKYQEMYLIDRYKDKYTVVGESAHDRGYNTGKNGID